MKKLIYKDDVYYFKQSDYYSIHYIKIYIKRETFWKFLFPYVRIAHESGLHPITISKMCDLINEWKKTVSKHNKESKPLVIDCSDEITSLYE